MTNGEIPPSRVLLFANSLATLHIFPFFISLASSTFFFFSSSFLSFFLFLITFHVYRWRNHDSFVTRNSCVNRDKWTERKICCRDWNSSLLIAVFGIFRLILPSFFPSVREGFVFCRSIDYFIFYDISD